MTAKRPDSRMSAVEAAFHVLAEAGEELNYEDITRRIFAKRLWKTDGRTPSATVLAAINNEMNTKHNESRFRRTKPGVYTVNNN